MREFSDFPEPEIDNSRQLLDYIRNMLPVLQGADPDSDSDQEAFLRILKFIDTQMGIVRVKDATFVEAQEAHQRFRELFSEKFPGAMFQGSAGGFEPPSEGFDLPEEWKPGME